ncbi:O-methyltransferase [Bacillaceae bacterium S4-13-58]
MEETLENYLLKFVPEKSLLIQEMEKYAHDYSIPIMEPLGLEFILQLLRMKNPKKILEIGTAIGYSAIRMAQACPTAFITTIERDQVRYEEALKNIKKAGLEERIEVVFGDAFDQEEIVSNSELYDVLFIDAAKGQYQRFFETFSKYVQENGMILTDNVLFHGYVLDETDVSNRKAKIGKKINRYNEWLTNLSDYQSVIVPLGDGVSITIKR